MKKYLIMLLSLLPLLVWGSQRTKTVTLSYNTYDFLLSQNGGKTSISSNVHRLLFGESEQEPALPMIPVNVLIGFNEEMVDFEASMSSDTTWSNIEMAACARPLPTNTRIPLRSGQPDFTATYNALVEAGETHEMDGYRFITFYVSPFIYTSQNSTLTLNRSIEIEVTLSTPENGGMGVPTILPEPGAVMREAVQMMCENPEDMGICYGIGAFDGSNAGNGGSLNQNENIYETQQPVEYIIVTSPMMKAAFQPLAEWKTRKGVKTKILTTDSIYAQYSGSSPQVKIKNALHDYYRGTHTGLKYVLLGGAPSIVPRQKCLVYRKHDDVVTDTATTPCDLFYASMKTIEWDSDHSDRYDTLDVQVSIDPDLFVTRIPVYSSAQAKVFIDRLLEYERNPNLEGWKNDILLAGTKMHYYYPNGMSDAQHNGEDLYALHINGKWNSDRVRLYDTYTDFPDGADYDFTRDHLQLELAKGYTFAHIETHGWYDFMQMEAGSNYNFNFSSNLQNSGYTNILTTACNTNAFDMDNCLSKGFICNANSGILSYYGSSREGYNPTSSELHGTFFDKLLADPFHCFGKAAILAKQGSRPGSTERWLEMAINPIGDPEMPIYLTRPQKLPPFTYSYTDTTLTINDDGNVWNVCVTSADDNGASYCVRKNTYVNHQVTFKFPPRPCFVCVMRPGYLPYTTLLDETAYVQNETLTDGAVITADRVFTGHHVTDQKAPGDAVFESGEYVIRGKNGVTLDRGTIIKKGAQVSVNPK